MLWLKWSVIITYADDTSTSVSGKLLTKIIAKLEEDALMVLKFMASDEHVTFTIHNFRYKSLGLR